jgi:hypothetical protein
MSDSLVWTSSRASAPGDLSPSAFSSISGAKPPGMRTKRPPGGSARPTRAARHLELEPKSTRRGSPAVAIARTCCRRGERRCGLTDKHTQTVGFGTTRSICRLDTRIVTAAGLQSKPVFVARQCQTVICGLAKVVGAACLPSYHLELRLPSLTYTPSQTSGPFFYFYFFARGIWDWQGTRTANPTRGQCGSEFGPYLYL